MMNNEIVEKYPDGYDNGVYLMGVSTDMFTWKSDTKTFIGEASENVDSRIPCTITLVNPKTNGMMKFYIKEVHRNTDEVLLWKYASVNGDIGITLFND